MKDISNFMGVSSVDTLLTPTSFPSYTIINFSPSNLPGTHFVSVIFFNKNLCLYFDSLNLAVIPQRIFRYMQDTAKHIIRIDYSIQNPRSIFCGFYSLVPIMLHVTNLPILRGILSFKECSMENDELCIRMLTRLFKLYYLEGSVIFLQPQKRKYLC